MTDQAKKSSPFLSMFVPGMVIGLIVGGIAGAFLPPILERQGFGLADAAPGGPVKTQQPVATSTEVRDRPPASAAVPESPAPTPDPKASEPTEAPKTEPKAEPKPADPATSPK